MLRLFAGLALSLVACPAALGFDAAVDAIVAIQKRDKPVSVAELRVLMGSSERWCYDQQDGSCAWSDIYLDVAGDNLRYEISNAWDAEREIALVDQAVFSGDRQICETGHDWLPSVRAVDRATGAVIGGRALEALKQEIAGVIEGAPETDCFEYRFGAADAENQTITLVQRQWRDGTYAPEYDIVVTLHFDANQAATLGLRW